jgi:hypothetical protein
LAAVAVARDRVAVGVPCPGGLLGHACLGAEHGLDRPIGSIERGGDASSGTSDHLRRRVEQRPTPGSVPLIGSVRVRRVRRRSSTCPALLGPALLGPARLGPGRLGRVGRKYAQLGRKHPRLGRLGRSPSSSVGQGRVSRPPRWGRWQVVEPVFPIPDLAGIHDQSLDTTRIGVDRRLRSGAGRTFPLVSRMRDLPGPRVPNSGPSGQIGRRLSDHGGSARARSCASVMVLEVCDG